MGHIKRATVVRFAPPLSFVRASVVDGRWTVRARRAGRRVEIEGEQGNTPPTVLPVPLPATRRNVNRDVEHLAAHLRLRVWRSGSLVIDDEISLAALEVGSTDLCRAHQLAKRLAVPVEQLN